MQAILLLMAMNSAVVPLSGSSCYPLVPDDPKAVSLDEFHPKADGLADDTDAIQQAIDKADGSGLVFVPAGRYRITRTITVWPGVRLIGFGAKRPVFLLAKSTPGYDKVENFMIFFAGRRGGRPSQDDRDESQNGLDFGMPNEANPGTFYSAMSNIDLEIKEGNPAAVAVRGRYAQHCYLAHMDFRLESGIAAIHDTGNYAEDLRFYGGDYGIITRTPSPGWQFTLIHSLFEGQKKAGIRTHETGLTMEDASFQNMPSAIVVDEGRPEQLWLRGSRMEKIAGPALVISQENSPRLQINVEDAVCRDAPVFAQLRESGRSFSGRKGVYRVKTFGHGHMFKDQGSDPQVRSVYEVEEALGIPSFAARIWPSLPPMAEWVNVRSLGAKGDGETDDTSAIQSAIEKARVLYFPSGHYRVTDTLALKADTALIGLNPISAQIVLRDGEAGFGGERGAPLAVKAKPLILTPQGGSCMVSGLGLDTGGANPAACGALWMSGEGSMMEDVKFLGGHGSGVPWNQIYDVDHTMDGNPQRKWDSQHPSLWVTDGGGGVFKNIWSASPYALSGMTISNTSTPGRVYQLSSEHHVRYEVQVKNASNWDLVALQTEEERGESGFCLPLEITGSQNITVANLNQYRVVSSYQPYPYAVKTAGSHDIRFRGFHCYSNSKASFDSALYDEDNRVEVRQREFSRLDIKGGLVRNRQAKVAKLASGFFNISGGVVDAEGSFYFVDSRWQRIYKWSVRTDSLSVIDDSPLSPVNLAIDRSGRLMVVSYAGSGSVYSIDPNHPRDAVLLKAQPAKERPGAAAWLPAGDWHINDSLSSGRPFERRWHYVSPDGSAYISATDDFVEGATGWGVKFGDVLRAYGLVKTHPGEAFYMSGESFVHTYVAETTPDGSLVKGRLFAEQGGEGGAVGPDGLVYLAAGQIYVYAKDGRLVKTIRVPERPIQTVFGGRDGKTLFVAARTSLYALRID